MKRRKMRFQDIPRMTRSHYSVNVLWDYLEDHLKGYSEDFGLDLNPSFQRDYVWTDKQKTKYVEYILRGGMSGREIYFNHPGWMSSYEGTMTIVDGKQRLSAVLDFYHNKIKAFGRYRSEFEGRCLEADFTFRVNNLKNMNDVYQWYIDLNAGGTIHTEEEIAKVRKLMS